MKTILHVGCGPKVVKLPREYCTFREVRVDNDPQLEPDMLASIVAMPMIPNEFHDAVFASHVLEHLYAHEVASALAEFYRVLKPGGIVDIRVPDLQSIGGKIAMDQAGDTLYQNGTFGAVAPLDLLYGHRGSVANGNILMAHKTGFTKSVLTRALKTAGFGDITSDTLTQQYELRVMATKKPLGTTPIPPTSVEEAVMQNSLE